MDKSSAVEEAVRSVLDAISDADGREMVGRRQPKEQPPMEAAPTECEACAKGECMDPEHASEDEFSAMMGD